MNCIYVSITLLFFVFCIQLFIWINVIDHGISCQHIIRLNDTHTRKLDMLIDNVCILGIVSTLPKIVNMTSEITCKLLEKTCVIQGGYPYLIEIILNETSYVNCDTTSFHPLHQCAESGCSECCYLLLTHGANPFFTLNGTTPLQRVNNNSIETAKIIMKFQENVSVVF